VQTILYIVDSINVNKKIGEN